MNDEYLMHRCLELAAQGRGLVGINPLVGAVLVRDGNIIAEGCYKGPNNDHAEADMIKKFDQEIRQTDGLFVNLEPCCHTGKTPPCTNLIIQSGIKKVIYGMRDPDPRVAGQGIEQLCHAGIEVIGPVCLAECERLNRGYISLRTKGRPYITIKKAQTTEGKIANDDGSRLCITSDDQNRWSHEYLRSRHDAILVGVGTVITDDPKLTNRMANGQWLMAEYQPLKIVLDPNLRIPMDAQCIDQNLIVIKKESEESEESKEAVLKKKGVAILSVPMIDNHFDWQSLWNTLSSKHSALSSILVEGGPTTWQAFRKAGLVDEEVVLVGSC